MSTQTFKKSTIKSLFKNTKLIFYNPKIIFQKIHTLLKFIHILTLILLDPIQKITLIYTTTFYYLYKVKNQAQTIINYIKKDH